MKSHMVRVDNETYSGLRDLAKEERDTIGRIIARVLHAYRQRKFWDSFDSAVKELRSDRAAWQAELDERAAWDATLGDGLGDDPYPMDGLTSDAGRNSPSEG